ncbi:hypothetical protein ACTVZO_00605 [Streptomyces sp. IBSNAI002]|uniref:hypothetical protein n=1 Tax=Streptomyces sp. IBSNAI002 TaxID=3457500 RepID=UPI003FD163C4
MDHMHQAAVETRGVGAGTVPADDLDAGMPGEPQCQRGGIPVVSAQGEVSSMPAARG